MQLDLSALQNAIAQLDEALAFCHSELANSNPRLALHLRAAAIQAFEFTYELCYKTLRRYLQATEPNPAAAEEMTFNELIRRGYALGLLQAEISTWQAFRKDRGTTSHTYDETKAAEIFAALPTFLNEARFLLQQIQTRQEGTV